ncbi:hypothetical protein BHE74_00055718 [Ensete ventricosum]|nr:hypothetical protein BHE74_00055718 [Ensete ventricosum]
MKPGQSLSRVPARSDQSPSPCSIGSAPARISSRAPARSNQFLSSSSVATSSRPRTTGRHVPAPPDGWLANVADPTRGSRPNAGMEGSAIIRAT